MIRVRDAEGKEKECVREYDRLKSEINSRDKEIQYMQEKIDKLNDPISLKFERDGLVQTYKKRLSELDEYVKKLEK